MGELEEPNQSLILILNNLEVCLTAEQSPGRRDLSGKQAPPTL